MGNEINLKKGYSQLVGTNWVIKSTTTILALWCLARVILYSNV